MESKEPAVLSVGEGCCGCGACAAVCPVSSLSMSVDKEGFLEPVYLDGCLSCDLCSDVCPVLNSSEVDLVTSAKWAKAYDASVLVKSSSGGVFGLLAREVVSNGGIVFGAAFADDFQSVKHVRVDKMADLDRVMRSKYVQSVMGLDVYKQIEESLREGDPILFSGTACQCSAIGNYLRRVGVGTEDLLLVDVICHGVPSPGLWAKWTEWVVRNGSGDLTGVSFRDKTKGWSSYSVAYEIDGDITRSLFFDDWYMKAFLANASLRRSCFNCPSKRKCGSDITLGDYWGIQKAHPEVSDDMGVSAVICNTAKGERALSALREQLDFGETTFDNILVENPALVHSVSPHSRRGDFMADFSGGRSMGEMVRKWTFEKTIKQKAIAFLIRVKRKIFSA